MARNSDPPGDAGNSTHEELVHQRSVREISLEEEAAASELQKTGDWSHEISDFDLPDGDARRIVPPGTMIDHFKVVRLVGRGGMGEVYLARDTVLGRKVALKIVHPDQMGSKMAADRFLFEARTTARFNHPHIVTVHGVGEYDSRPYVALEYLEGHTLRDRMAEELPRVRETMRYGLAIAEALAEAHAAGILHRDLKPENVLIPRDGRLRVVDFGLAQVVRTTETDPAVMPPPASADLVETMSVQESEGRHICGTPAYMSPEQWEGAPPAESTDIWALGTILYELVCGHRPYHDVEPSFVTLILKVSEPEQIPSDPALREISGDLRDLILRCMEKDPYQRPTAIRVRDALREMLFSGRNRLSTEQTPFRGLAAFTERHASFFFGRSSETEAFLERMREETVLPVVGPSGSGKSSFVFAGVVPRLREQASWTVLAMRPGSEPFLTLAARLVGGDSGAARRGGFGSVTRKVGGQTPAEISRVMTAKITDPQRQTPTTPDVESPTAPQEPDVTTSLPPAPDAATTARSLMESPTLVGLMLQQIAERDHCKVLLLVDQLEELYTLVEDDTVRRRFMQALCTAADDALAPVRVIFTLRDDFIGRLAEGPEARDALSHVTVIRSPAADSLREILTRPLQQCGYEFDDPGLVAEMVRAVRGEPACLPLLQFTLRTLWDRRDRIQRRLCRNTYDVMGGVAGALADHADGVLQGMSASQIRVARELLLRLVTPDGTRKVLPASLAVDQLGAEAGEVLARLTGSRLISVRKSHGGSGLLSASSSHSAWHSNAPDDATLELVHESLVRSWGRLSQWLDESREELAFLAEVQQAAELWQKRGGRSEEVWRGEALHEAQRVLGRSNTPLPVLVQQFIGAGADEEARLLRRRRIRTAAAWGLLVLVALVSTGVAIVMGNKERKAEMRWAEAQREGARAALLRGDPLEARAKLRISVESQDSPLARSLWWTLRQEPLVWKKDLGAYLYDGALSRDGQTIAAGSAERAVYLVDVRTRQIHTILRGFGDQVFSVAFSPTEDVLAVNTREGLVSLWDADGKQLKVLPKHRDRARDLAFSADGELLAAGAFDGGSIPVWNVASGELIRVLEGHQEMVRGIAFSPDRQWLASTSDDGTVRLWDPDTGKQLKLWSEGGNGTTSVAFNLDGCTLAYGTDSGWIKLLDPSTGRLLAALDGHKTTVLGLAFSPDGTLLASGGDDQTIRVWDLERNREIVKLTGHTASINALNFSADGTSLVSTSADKSVRVWSLEFLPSLERWRGHSDWLVGGSFAVDGRSVVTAGGDHTVRQWDVDTGRVTRVMRGHTAEVSDAVITPDGGTLVSGSWDKTLRRWNTVTGDAVGSPIVLPSWSRDLAMGPQGATVASACHDGTVGLWELATGALLHRFQHGGRVLAVAYHPDGKTVASGGDNRLIQLWDTSSGAKLQRLQGHTGPVRGLDFSADGRYLVSGSNDATARVWDLEHPGGAVSQLLEGHGGAVYDPSFHPDGNHVGTPCADGTARIWDLRDGSYVELRGHRSEVNFLIFEPDGGRAVTGSDDDTVRLWDVATGVPIWRAPALLTSPPRTLTQAGWFSLEPDQPAPTGESAWEQAVQHQGRMASVRGADDRLCLATYDGGVQLWDLPEDRIVQRFPSGAVEQVLATPAGCVVRQGGDVRLLGEDGTALSLSAQGQLVAVDGADILVATGEQLLRFDRAGNLKSDLEADVGITALTRVGGWVAVGFREGDIQFVAAEPSAPVPGQVPPPFEDVPSSQVVAMLEGPMDTIVAGYANGLLGIWDLSNGTALHRVQLHGPVRHLLLQDGKLYAVSELGDHAVLDLDTFYDDYCDLMRSIWDTVPVVWRGGRPITESPPPDHPCAGP